jgi:glucosamine 6-phosphate synthetase-like amidotransferase/phosphosugar isomerase protein
MCGIFGFALKRHAPMAKVFRVLQKMEVHQYPQEAKPLGGYGAGIAILKKDGSVLLEKVGKCCDASPAKCLSKTVNINEASVLIGHVRMPSSQFMETAKFKETAQPYVAQCFAGSTIVSVHNGNVTNYEIIREKLGAKHAFESEKIELIDSEVIPHLFEELLIEKANPSEALFDALEGSNTLSILQIEKRRSLLHFVHKGKTRGLTIWKNDDEEVVFCSRKEPLMETFGDMLSKGGFKEQVSISYGEDGNLKMSLVLPSLL